MNKTAQMSTHQAEAEMELHIRLLKFRANYPHIKMNQEKIGEAIGCDQSTVSLAFRKPERVPGPAKRIREYFDRLESQMQSTQTKSTVA